MTEEEDYIPFEGNFHNRMLTPEETKKHKARFKKALEKRKMDEGLGG